MSFSLKFQSVFCLKIGLPLVFGTIVFAGRNHFSLIFFFFFNRIKVLSPEFLKIYNLGKGLTFKGTQYLFLKKEPGK